MPHGLFPRFSAIRNIAHSYRNGDIKHKTKIKYGVEDFLLLVKPKNQPGPWKYVSLKDLPPLSLSPSPSGSPQSSAQPPFRPRLRSKRSLSPDVSITDHVRSTKTKLSNAADTLPLNEDAPSRQSPKPIEIDERPPLQQLTSVIDSTSAPASVSLSTSSQQVFPCTSGLVASNMNPAVNSLN